MGIPIELRRLESVMARYRFAYLPTNNDNGAPDAVQVTAWMRVGGLVVSGVVRRTRENALARPAVDLIGPQHSEADYSLIVDGQTNWNADMLQTKPTRAVLHRPPPPSTPNVLGSCQSDCVELSLTSQSSITSH